MTATRVVKSGLHEWDVLLGGVAVGQVRKRKVLYVWNPDRAGRGTVVGMDEFADLTPENPEVCWEYELDGQVHLTGRKRDAVNALVEAATAEAKVVA